MRTIYKFQIPVGDRTIIPLPQGAEILTVQVQYGNPCIWVLLNPGEPVIDRRFILFGTGHPIHDIDDVEIENYIGTYQLQDGGLVFHLFEVLKP